MVLESAMLTDVMSQMDLLATLGGWIAKAWNIVLVIIGFSVVILFHELGHFFAAKWCGVRVEKLAIGFGREVIGWTRGETRYCLNLLPLGGYVKMLGQEDFEVDKSKEWAVSEDPRSFIAQSVGKRAIIISAGVIMNVVFTGLVFMIVFMVGLPSIPPKVGFVMPDTPAHRAGMQVGDVIEQINGRPMDDFPNVSMAIALADVDQPLQFKIDRGGEKVQVEIPPEYNPDRQLLQIGIGPSQSLEVEYVSSVLAAAEGDALQPGDVIKAVDGHAVKSYAEFQRHVLAAAGRDVTVEFDRPEDPADPDGPTKSLSCSIRAGMTFMLSQWGGEIPRNSDSGTLLGLLPRTGISYVNPGTPASRAVLVTETAEAPDEPGLLIDDVIVRWGTIESPRVTEIQTRIREGGGETVRVVVLRGDLELEFDVTPRAPIWPPWSTAPPSVGLALDGQDVRHPVVADTMADSPASGLAIPRGASIASVDSQPVSDWYDIVRLLGDCAGRKVTVEWAHGDQTGRGELAVPSSLTRKLGLSPVKLIRRINGKSHVAVGGDQRPRMAAANSWQGVQALCREALGDAESVEVEFELVDGLAGGVETKTITVTQADLDPWLMRTHYALAVGTGPERFFVRASNPLRAMLIGAKRTLFTIYQTYISIERIIFSRTVGIEKLSGPVGIVKMGSHVASVGFVELLYFLGIISASLAVINFLPLPIVDGGLMVFLLIEKIKGSPVNLKLQMITQLVGLALIIFAFVYITIQDIVNWN